MKKNIKGIGNKGFTLIELLAVVVILAIVMSLAGSSVINSMNSSRKSTLLSAAQSAANNINEWAAEDQLVTDENSLKLGDSFLQTTQSAPETWNCIGEVTINNGGTQVPLSTALGLSEKDLILTGSAVDTEGTPTDGSNCSAVRYSAKSGAYEVVLVTTKAGRYYVAKNSPNNFAFNRASVAGIKLDY